MANKSNFGSGGFGRNGSFGNLNQGTGAGKSRAPFVQFDDLDDDQKTQYQAGYKDWLDQNPDDYVGAALHGEDRLFTWQNNSKYFNDQGGIVSGALNTGASALRPSMQFDDLNDDDKRRYQLGYKSVFDPQKRNFLEAASAGETAVRETRLSLDQQLGESMLGDLGKPRDQMPLYLKDPAYIADLLQMNGATQEQIDAYQKSLSPSFTFSGKQEDRPYNPSAAPMKGDRAEGDAVRRFDELMEIIGGTDSIQNDALRDEAKKLEEAVNYERDYGAQGLTYPEDRESTLAALQDYASRANPMEAYDRQAPGFRAAAEAVGYTDDSFSELTDEAQQGMLDAFYRGGAEAVKDWDEGEANQLDQEGRFWRPEGETGLTGYHYEGRPEKETFLGDLGKAANEEGQVIMKLALGLLAGEDEIDLSTLHTPTLDKWSENLDKLKKAGSDLGQYFTNWGDRWQDVKALFQNLWAGMEQNTVGAVKTIGEWVSGETLYHLLGEPEWMAPGFIMENTGYMKGLRAQLNYDEAARQDMTKDMLARNEKELIPVLGQIGIGEEDAKTTISLANEILSGTFQNFGNMGMDFALGVASFGAGTLSSLRNVLSNGAENLIAMNGGSNIFRRAINGISAFFNHTGAVPMIMSCYGRNLDEIAAEKGGVENLTSADYWLATGDAFFNSMIELGGGEIPSGVQSWLDSRTRSKGFWADRIKAAGNILSEVLEEEGQDMEKMVLENFRDAAEGRTPEHALFSKDDTDAIISMARAWDVAVKTAGQTALSQPVYEFAGGSMSRIVNKVIAGENLSRQEKQAFMDLSEATMRMQEGAQNPEAEAFASQEVPQAQNDAFEAAVNGEDLGRDRTPGTDPRAQAAAEEETAGTAEENTGDQDRQEETEEPAPVQPVQEEAEEEAPAEREETQTPQQRAPETMGPAQTPEDLERMADALEKMGSPQTVVDDLRRRAEQMRAGQTNMPTGQDVSADEDEQSGIGPVAQRIMESDKSGGKTPAQKEDEKRASGSVLRRRPGMPEGPVKEATERKSGSVLRDIPEKAGEKPAETKRGSVLRPVKNATERTAEEEKRTSGSVLRTHPGMAEESEKEPEKRTSGSVLRPVKNATERTAEEEKRTSGSVLRTHPGMAEESEKEPEKRTSGSVLRPVKNATERTAEEEKRTSGSVLRTHPGTSEGSEKEPEKRTSGSVLRPVKNATERTAEEEKRTSGSVLRTHPGMAEESEKEPEKRTSGSVLRPVKNATERTEEDEKRTSGSVLRNIPERTGEKPAETKRGSVLRPVKNATERTPAQEEDEKRAAGSVLRGRPARPVKDATERTADEIRQTLVETEQNVQNAELMLREAQTAQAQTVMAANEEGLEADERARREQAAQDAIKRTEALQKEYDQARAAADAAVRDQQKQAENRENQQDSQESELVLNGEGPGPVQERPGYAGEEQEMPGRTPVPRPENELTPDNPEPPTPVNPETPQTAQDDRQEGTPQEEEVTQELVNNGEGPGPDQVRPGNVGEEQEKPGRKPAPEPEQEKTEVTQKQGQEQGQTPQTAQDNRQEGTPEGTEEEEEGVGKQEGKTGLTEEKTETGNADTDNEEETKRRQQKTADDINDRYGFNKRSTDGGGKTRPGLTVNSWDGEVSDSQRVELQVIHDYAKEHGFSVIVDSSIKDPNVRGRINGQYISGQNGGLTIQLAQDGTQPLRTTLGHELYHMIKNLNKDGARRIEKLYRDFARRQGVDIDRMVTNKLVAYRNMGIELSPYEAAARTAALEEVIADSMYDIIGDERTMRALAMQDRSLAERLMDWVDRMMKDIHKMLDKYGSSKAEAKVLHDQYGAMENMRAAVERALAETKELRDAKKAATSLGSNSRMLDEYRSAMDAAESREDMNAATLALAGQVLEKAGVEQSWDNIRKLLTGAAEYAYGGGAVSQVLNEYGMNTWIPSDEANRAFVSIGRYMKQMLDAHDEAGYAQILGMDQENAEGINTDSIDSRYMRAVNEGDTKEQRSLVQQAAEQNMAKSKMRTRDGRLRIFYHGTNADGVTVFSKDKIGTRNPSDKGWFGKGFYFAYNRSGSDYQGKKKNRWQMHGASNYGENIIGAYLYAEKPFNFQSELETIGGISATYDGNNPNGKYRSAVVLTNLVRKFPEALGDRVLKVYDGDAQKWNEVTYKEFADRFYQRAMEYHDLNKAKFYQTANIPLPEELIQSFDFSGEVRKLGYDAVIESEDGDEAVVFESSQIKSADPVTYDDAGNVIPLSERFNEQNQDIRYSAEPETEEDPSIRDVKDDIRYSMDADGARDMVDLGSDIARADQSAWQLIDTIRQMKMRTTQDADGAAQQTPGYWKKMTGEIAKSLQEYTYGKDQKTVEKAVRELFSALDGYDGDARGFVEFALREAQSTMRDLYTDDAENPTRDNLKAFFEQHGPLYVTPEQKKELQYFAGGMTAFRRQAAGLVPITSKKTGVGLEEIWSELAPLIGKDPDIVSVGTMIMEFNDAVEKARSVNGMERTLSDEEIAMLDRRALDLVAEYMQAGATVVPTRTVEKVDADRHQEALKEVSRLQEETDKQQEEIDRLNRKLEQADTANQSLNRQVFDRAAVIEQLKQGGATRAEVEEARAAYREKAEEAAQAVQAMKDIQKKLEEARAKRDQYRKELAQARWAEQAYEKAQHQIERLQAGRDSLKKQIEKLKLQAMDTRLRARQMKERRSLLDSVRKIGGRMRNMLASPSEAKGYIPLDHVRAVADLAEAMVNNDGRASAAKMSRRLENAIRDARESTDYNTSRMYEDELNEAMREVTKLLEDKGSLNNLSNTELEFVSDTLTAVETSIRNSNMTIGREKNEALGKESADAIRVMRENPRELKGLGRLIRRGVLTQLNPQRFFAIWGHHGDNAITRMGEEASEGQRKKNKLSMDMTKKFEALTQGKNEKLFDKFTGKNATWYDTGIQILNEDGSDSGRTWKMNGAMRAFFGLSWQAEENREGMRTGARSETGGELYQLTIPDEELMKKGKEKEAYARGERVYFTAQQAQAILDEMTDYEKSWMDAWREMEKLSKAAINETSMLLYGFRKAKVGNYVPIFRDPRYIGKEFEAVVTDSRLTSMGFMHERVNAHNPMMLMDLTNVINRQVRDVSDLYGFAVPTRNMTRIYNGKMAGDVTSVKEVINKTQGMEVGAYFEKLMGDLQGGSRVESSISDKVRGNVAGAVLAGNPSVIIKQAASYPAAAAVLGWKPLMKAMRYFNPVGLKGINVEEIDRYTSALWERRSRSLSDLEANANRNTPMSKTLHKLLNGIQGMDIATTRVIWRAAEYYVEENNKDLKRGTEEFNEAVARVYEQALEGTQPEYGTMQRPQVLRSTNQLVKSVTMYKTQSLQNFGILVDAATNYTDKKAALKRADTAENRQALQAAKSQLAAAVSSQVTSAVILAVMTALGKALIHKMGGYRDDKGDLTAESVGGQLLRDSASSVAGMVVGGSELFDLVTGLIDGQSPFDIEAAGVSTINDLYQNIFGMGNAASALFDADMTPEQKLDKLLPRLRKLGYSIAQMKGIPVQNVLNLLDGIAANTADFVTGKPGSFASNSPLSIAGTPVIGSAQGRDTSNKSVAGYIAQAMMDGNEAEATRLYNEQLRQGKKADALNTAIAGWQKANIPEIREAAEAIDGGDLTEYNRLINEIVGKGVSMTNAVKYVEAERKKSQEGSREQATGSSNAGSALTYQEIVAGMTKETATSEANAYTNGMMNSLLEDGNVDAAKAVRDDMLANGKKAASINSSLTSYWKPLLQAAYENGDMAEVRRITSMLVEMGMKRTTVSGWTQEKSGSSSSSSKKKSGFGSGSFGSGSFGSSGKKSSKKSGFGSGSFGSGKFGS